MKQIKALRDQNVPVEAIADRLSSPAIKSATVAGQIAPIIEQEGPNNAPTSLVVLESINAVQRRIEALERGRMTVVTAFGLGFIAALLLMLAVIGLAVLYGGFN